MKIRIGSIPGRIEEILLNDGSTVQDAINTAELSADGFDVKVNGNSASLTSRVNEGDEVILAKVVKGA